VEQLSISTVLGPLLKDKNVREKRFLVKTLVVIEPTIMEDKNLKGLNYVLKMIVGTAKTTKVSIST
jgi:hypothetical protein